MIERIPPVNELGFVLQYITLYIDKKEPEKYTFKAILQETNLGEKMLGSILSDLQLSGLIVYSKEKPGYYLPTLRGEEKAKDDYMKLLEWLTNENEE
jgi:predicted transcriptional regulator